MQVLVGPLRAPGWAGVAVTVMAWQADAVPQVAEVAVTQTLPEVVPPQVMVTVELPFPLMVAPAGAVH